MFVICHHFICNVSINDDVSMFECKLCVDTIMRIQTEIPRIIVLTVVPPTGKQCISFGRESGRQFWRDAAVDS